MYFQFCNKSYVNAAFALGLVFPILNILECLGKEPEEVGHGVLGALFAGFLIFGAYNRNSNSIQVWMILVFLDIIIYIITGKEILESFLVCMYLGSFTLPLPLYKAK